MQVTWVACALCVGCMAFSSAWCALGEVRGFRARGIGQGIASAWKEGSARIATRRRRSRRETTRLVTKDMPVFLDIVVLGICAGLSFDASLDLYCERFDSPLAQMVTDAMLSWRMGIRGRGEAIKDLAREVDTPAMTRFATAVVDALSFGTPLAEGLERQAQLIRDEQQSSMEEEIERVPVRMLIPLGTLIVPAMLLAILGPLLGPALSVA